MPEPVPQPSPQQAPPGAGQQQGQPPVGSSPATGPTQNRGYEIAAIKMTGMALKVLEMVIPLAGSSSELGRGVMDSIKKLGAFVPPGSVSPADMQGMIQQLIVRQQQFGKQMQTMRQGAQQPQPQQGGGQAQPQPAPQQQAA